MLKDVGMEVTNLCSKARDDGIQQQKNIFIKMLKDMYRGMAVPNKYAASQNGTCHKSENQVWHFYPCMYAVSHGIKSLKCVSLAFFIVCSNV